MNIEQAQAILESSLRVSLADVGFWRSGDLTFSRKIGHATGALTLACRVDPLEQAWFAGNVTLHFEALADLLADETSDRRPHLLIPLHLLRQKGEFREWSFRGAGDIRAAVDSFLIDVRELAVPFLLKYSELSAVREHLDSENPADWFLMSPEDRIVMLAAIRFVGGDRAAALSDVRQALAARISALPKKRRALEDIEEKMRSRIV